MKIWIAGSVAQYGEEENIKELVKTFDYFDGAFFNINYEDPLTLNSPRGNITFDQLYHHKKDGRIVWTPWLKRHDWAMNAFLHMIPNGDAFMYIDAQELPKINFLKAIRSNIEECKNQGIESIWWNRPYVILNKSPEMQFIGNPHAWLHGIKGKYINIADESKVLYDENGVHFGDFIYNKKKRENTMILHGIKYSLYNPPNNQFSMFYKGEDLQQHECQRVWFCDFLREKGYDLDLKGLEKFFSNKENLTSNIINYLNYEFVFRDFYRYKILNHSVDEILKDRYTYKIYV